MNEERRYKVYVLIAPNSKVYVGMSGLPIEQRWRNGDGYKNNKHFYPAIEQFGWNNFQHIVLYENLTKEEAMQKEIETIADYKSDNPEYGYNISKGGWPCNKGLSEEEKKERRKACIKRWEESNKEHYLEIRRKYDNSQHRKDYHNALNKTPKRRQHRTEYMRKWRAEHPDYFKNMRFKHKMEKILNEQCDS